MRCGNVIECDGERLLLRRPSMPMRWVLGTYTIMATFDAGAPQPYRTVNGVAIDGTEADATQ
jgi:hypothetical protein